MKPHAPILLILCVVFSACRSSRSLDSNVSELHQDESFYTRAESGNKTVESQYSDSVFKQRDENRYLRTLEFNPDGSIRSLSEEWRNIGSSELALSGGRSSETSDKKVKESEARNSENQFQEQKKETVKTDSRPVQGSEWFWIIISLAAVGGVVLFIIKRK